MFLLDLQSKEPIYEQIQTQILKFIEVGILSPGDKLPSVRQLAQDNGINPNTVAKAYGELEKNGYVNNVPKKGVYVASIEASNTRHERLVQVMTSLKEGGYEKVEINEVLDEIYGEEDPNA